MEARKKIHGLTIWLLALSCAAPACSRGESHVPAHESLIADLGREMGRAVVDDSDFGRKYRALSGYPKMYREPREAGSPRLVKVGFDIDPSKKFQNMRRVVYLGAYSTSPCSVSIPFRIAKSRGLVFSFALGGYGLSPGYERRLEIRVSSGKQKKVLLDSAKHPGAVPEQRWRDYRVPLPEMDLREAVLELRFRTSSPLPEHLFIANPCIFGKDEDAAGRPNVVFISVDALRSDAVEAITKRYALTPNMDSLAKEGVSFSNHFVVSNWTRPSTIAMLASAYAYATGVNIFYPPVSDGEKEIFYHRSGVLPVTSILKRRGYITRSIGNNAFIIDYTGIGVDLDFDELSEYETQWEDTVDITDETVEWLERNRNRSFFLFINYNAPHNAYIPPEKYLAPLRKRLTGIHPWFRAYLGEVAYTDDYLGRVLSALKRLGLYDNTIIVLTSDHGEIFSAAHEMSPYTDVKAIFTHGQTQLDEELRVPLIIKPAEGRFRKNMLIDAQVRNVDIVPTILEMMDLPVPAACQGKSLLPVIDGKEREERTVYCEGRMMYSVRAHGYKYAERFYGFGLTPYSWGGDTVREYAELFDLSKDPDEENNIVQREPNTTVRMREILRRERFRQPENTLMARGMGARGTVRIDAGFFYGIRVTGEGARIKRISRKEYSFTLAAGSGIVFQTIPADAAVTVNADGARLLSGPFLLPLARASGKGAYHIDSSLRAAQGRPGSDILALIDRGLCYWNEPSGTGVRGVKNEKYLSKDINRLLQNWGYIQGKEKKE